MANRMIVAEVSKTWRSDQLPKKPTILSELFEDVIATNERRGYRLHSWRMTSIAAELEDEDGNLIDVLTETIIAVFELAQ